MLRARRGGHCSGVRVRRILTFLDFGYRELAILENSGSGWGGDDRFDDGGKKVCAGRDQDCFRSLCSLFGGSRRRGGVIIRYRYRGGEPRLRGKEELSCFFSGSRAALRSTLLNRGGQQVVRLIWKCKRWQRAGYDDTSQRMVNDKPLKGGLEERQYMVWIRLGV